MVSQIWWICSVDDKKFIDPLFLFYSKKLQGKGEILITRLNILFPCKRYFPLKNETKRISI